MVHARGSGRGSDRGAGVAEVGLPESRRSEEEGARRSQKGPAGGQMSSGATSVEVARRTPGYLFSAKGALSIQLAAASSIRVMTQALKARLRAPDVSRRISSWAAPQ